MTTQASQLGISLFEDTEPFNASFFDSHQEIETVIRAVYRQVLGNAYVMESERLVVPESKLKNGEITVREFVRQVAKSDLYRERFFESSPRYRFIELNFKHLLGRAPDSYEEMKAHSQILDEGGFEAEIDTYLDSDEYQQNFGENIVPYYRGYKTQTGKSLVGFTHLFQLLRGACSSDRSSFGGTQSRLNKAIATNTPSTVIPLSRAQSPSPIAAALKAKAKKYTPPSTSVASVQAYQSLKQKCQEQDRAIAVLQERLSDLKPFASIGSAYLSAWQSSTSTPSEPSRFVPGWQVEAQQETEIADSYEALQRQSKEQAETIATLEQEILEAQRFATIGEAKLNKWRSRTFF
ncbi:phycobilisome rod-core linker polypeptide [Lusitaniella coriacea]|uniref:phycobilisome rod-core linker polypeptide n=1 Tax=Lusitaniella coriacea TaxID=1983105 RepID=UPI003CF735F3